MTIVPAVDTIPAILVPAVVVDTVSAIVAVPIACTVYRRDGSCPLHPGLIKQILEYIHGDLRFTLTRHGLGDANELIPTKLSMRAIINARLMDYYKDVLLGASLREKTWPIVESNAMYDDVIPWLQANRCPRIYTDITVLAANDYGIYRRHKRGFYDGDWRDGKRHTRSR